MSRMSMKALRSSSMPAPHCVDETTFSILNLARLPTPREARACYELCRLQKNIGLWTTWLPAAWSILMAYHANPHLSTSTTLFYLIKYIPLCLAVKSLIMTIDDILDADIDAHVVRTASRPIPRGAISLPRAWLFFSIQVIIGVWAAYTFMHPLALRLSMWVWPIFVVYPTFKRWMDFAPIPLGFMLKAGAMIGWADIISITPGVSVDWYVVGPLYLAGVFWTVAYETIYQHMDKEDDVKLGVRSLALYLGRSTIPVCTFCGISFIMLLTAAGVMNGQGQLYYAGLSCAGTFLIAELVDVNIDDPISCRSLFWNTPKVGGIILGGLMLDVATTAMSRAAMS